MIRRPPRSTLFPTRRSSDLHALEERGGQAVGIPHGENAHGPEGQGLQRGPEVPGPREDRFREQIHQAGDRKSTRLNSSHVEISYAVFCLKKKKKNNDTINNK